jgi:prephenate dehydrogenase
MSEVGIIGLGLIGGSLGQALRGLDGRVRVTGIVRTDAQVAAAEARGAVDRAGTSLDLLRDCRLVVIATPITQCATVLAQLGRVIPDQTLITDVASVKQPVLEWARALPSPDRFLGGHPMAGKTESGLSHSDPALFVQTPWVFTPRPGQDLTPFQWWLDLVTAIGARPVVMAADEHDRRAAYVSHLAFTLSAAYVATVRDHGGDGMAGPGYRTMARLAAGDPRMYGEIATTNQGALLGAIDAFLEVLQHYRSRIADRDRLPDLFSEAMHADR